MKIKIAIVTVATFLVVAAVAMAAPYLHLEESFAAAEGSDTVGNSYNDPDVLYTCQRIGCYRFERWNYDRVSSIRLCVRFRFYTPSGAIVIGYRSYRADSGYKINDAEGC